MTATHERTGAQRIARSTGVSASRRRSSRRHADAMIQAEVRRLARALAPYRVAGKDALRVTRLPADFYAYCEPSQHLSGSDLR